MSKCPKCDSMNIKINYKTGLSAYYLCGRNRDLQQLKPNESALIDINQEHFEKLCETCNYGWIEEIKN